MEKRPLDGDVFGGTLSDCHPEPMKRQSIGTEDEEELSRMVTQLDVFYQLAPLVV